MKSVALSITVGMVLVAESQAVTITHGSTSIDMEFVTIGHAGNVANTTGYGTVDYDYQIGKFEVTIEQFEAVRAADIRVGDGDETYWNEGSRTVGVGGPASYVSGSEAMKFANWLTTGDAHLGVYQFDVNGAFSGADRDAAVSAYSRVFVVPTHDEWYKAAYFKADGSGYSLYANGSDNVVDLIHGTTDGWNYRIGSTYVNGSPNYMWETGFGAEEQNGTYDMMGNVWEFTETAWDGTLSYPDEPRRICGGTALHSEDYMRSSYRGSSATPQSENLAQGFRIAIIPEPSSIAMIGLVSGGFCFIRRRIIV